MSRIWSPPSASIRRRSAWWSGGGSARTWSSLWAGRCRSISSRRSPGRSAPATSGGTTLATGRRSMSTSSSTTWMRPASARAPPARRPSGRHRMCPMAVSRCCVTRSVTGSASSHSRPRATTLCCEAPRPRRKTSRRDGFLPALVVDQRRAVHPEPCASVDVVDRRLDRVGEQLVAPRAQDDAGNAVEVDRKRLERDILGAVVDDAEFLLVAERMALDEGKVVDLRRPRADAIELPIAHVAEANAVVRFERIEQPVTVELDARAVQTVRKYLPMVVGLAGGREAGCKHRRQVLLLCVLPQKMGVVAIVPGRRAQQHERLAAQELNQGGE